jgi:aminoglycoside phosphotransferase (APT) family kinase protein
MHVLDLEHRDGIRAKVVLRRSRSEHEHYTAADAVNEFRVLGILEQAAIAAPRPLLLDADGEYFGVPAMVLSYIHGRSIFPTTDLDSWTEGLAAVLLEIHRLTPVRFDLSWLPVSDRPSRERLQRNPPRQSADLLVHQIHRALLGAPDRVRPQATNLIHDDFWPGNTIWYRRRLVGIVDWSEARLGDPRSDVSTCRVDLVMSHGPDVADAFLHDYERLSGATLRDLSFFDLYRGVTAFEQYPLWIKGYHDIGLPHLREQAVGARLRAFLTRALTQAPG